MSVYPKARPKSGNSNHVKTKPSEPVEMFNKGEEVEAVKNGTIKAQEEQVSSSLRPSSGLNPVGASNPGVRLLDACFDDVGYARYLLTSRLPSDRNIRNKVNWKDPNTNNSLLHCLSYSDLVRPTKLLLEFGADPNIKNNVRKIKIMLENIYLFLNFYFSI